MLGHRSAMSLPAAGHGSLARIDKALPAPAVPSILAWMPVTLPFHRAHVGLAAAVLCAGLHTAQAWGPHPAITLAALNTLGPNDPLFASLGAQAHSLTNFCWMADFKRTPFPDGSGYFYSDDYLLFPGMP